MSDLDTSEISSINDILSAKQHNTNADVVDVDETLVKLVVFTLDKNWYAFPSENIKEVLSDIPVSVLPGCPASLEGVINVRGDIESVISLRSLLNYGSLTDTANSRILIGATEAMRSGIRVDTVEEIIAFSQTNIKAPPSTLPTHMVPIVTGAIQLKNHTVTILDLEKMFENYRDGLQG